MDRGIFMKVKPSKLCQSGWDIQEKRKLGVGSVGHIYNTCCGDNCKYVAKIQKDRSFVDREIILQNKAAEYGLSIPILDSWKYDGLKVIIMKALYITLEQYIENVIFDEDMDDDVKLQLISERLCDLLNKLYILLYKLNIHHIDIKSNNIMLDVNDDLYIIDFGIAMEIADGDKQLILEEQIKRVFDPIEELIDDLYSILIENVKKCKLPEPVQKILLIM